jgi:hypothetical protein
VNDHRDLKMFVRRGREPILAGLAAANPIALVSSWEGGVAEAENVRRLHDLDSAGFATQSTTVYGRAGDRESAYLLLFATMNDPGRRASLRRHCRRLVRDYRQPGHVEWDGQRARFVPSEGDERPLRPFDGTVECLDAWYGAVCPGFRAEGTFDRSFGYTQQRWRETAAGP